MLSTVSSLFIALGLGWFAVELPSVQSLMLIAASAAVLAFCGSLETWSCERAAQLEQQRRPAGRAREPREEEYF